MTDKADELHGKINAIWADDKLNRQADAAMVYRFLTRQLEMRANAGKARTFVLNLDSDWGSGKSFFLDRFQQELTARGHVAVYVNAWEDDHSDDPFLAVVTAVQAGLAACLPAQDGSVAAKAKPLLRTAGKLVGAASVGAGKQLLTRYLGRETSAALKEIMDGAGVNEDVAKDMLASSEKGLDILLDGAGKTLLDSFEAQKAARVAFKEQLVSLAQAAFEEGGMQRPVFVLIDELDRCRPAYAVELLERVKHLFSVEDFVFVLGSDTEQLSHAIRGLYGGDFDGTRYLKRFIDRTYKFQETEMADFVQHTFDRLGLREDMFTLPSELTAVGFLEKMFGARGIELRDIEQIMEVFATFVAVWPWDNVPVNLIALLPLVHKQHLNFRIGAEYDPPMLKQEMVFRKFAERGFTSLAFKGMHTELLQRSSSVNRPSSPNNSYSNWVIDAVVHARRLMKTDDPQGYDNPLAEYPRILATVATLQEDPPKDTES